MFVDELSGVDDIDALKGVEDQQVVVARQDDACTSFNC